MTNNKNEDSIQLRSQEVQELIGHIPGGFMRYGIGLILVLLILVLVACNFIPYSETKSFQLRVLPNVPAESLCSPFDGNIMNCWVIEGSFVSAGDTLLTIHADGKLHILKAANNGKVKLCSFCERYETVKKGQPLIEIYQQNSIPQPLLLIADTLPNFIPLEQFHTIEVDIHGQEIPFNIVRTIEDKETGRIQALFQSDKYIEVTRQHRIMGKVVTYDGVLIEKLLQINK
ncbi:MAG: hypothetical protein NC113_05090 [Bacteroides sp.]|nr:hypothetical protein [Bacteroides sp.]MCM1447584.1 hypothetical protein [Bacteroides sp.]